MSETNKMKEIPNNTTSYIVFGKENELEKVTVTGENTQDPVHIIPGTPMEIDTQNHKVTNELGEPVSRVDKNGKKIPASAKYTTVGKELERIDNAKEGQDR